MAISFCKKSGTTCVDPLFSSSLKAEAFLFFGSPLKVGVLLFFSFSLKAEVFLFGGDKNWRPGIVLVSRASPMGLTLYCYYMRLFRKVNILRTFLLPVVVSYGQLQPFSDRRARPLGPALF